MSGNRDREILRTLGARVAEIAALPAQQETIRLWKALNGLRPVRPMVMIDQICWHEMNVDGELTLRCEDEFCRALETDLRRTLYRWKHLPADMVVEPVVEAPRVITGAHFGIRAVEDRAVTDPENDIVGHFYHDQLQTEDDLEKIQMPDARLDEVATAHLEARAHDLFDGVLNVRMQGLFPPFSPWDRIVEWRGAKNVLLDLADRPEFIHSLMRRVTAAYLALLDQCEERGLLGTGQTTIHCTGAHTDELPAPGYDPARPRAKDLWTFGMAQIFATVSPAMHQEFDLDYARPWYERFGLVYYGCCEPLHRKLDLVKRIPNVRKVSMSPWVDQAAGAEAIGGALVFSRKPSPAFLATHAWQPDLVEADLQETVETCRRYGTPLELILKDISTVAYQPQRLWEWAAIAQRVAEG